MLRARHGSLTWPNQITRIYCPNAFVVFHRRSIAARVYIALGRKFNVSMESILETHSVSTEIPRRYSRYLQRYLWIIYIVECVRNKIFTVCILYVISFFLNNDIHRYFSFLFFVYINSEILHNDVCIKHHYNSERMEFSL